MATSRKLGKGLGSLLATRHASESAEAGGPLWVEVSQLLANTQQPRKDTQKGLKGLADSLRRHGMMQPIIVTAAGDSMYEILAGERRWRASKMAGFQRVPVIVRGAISSEAERLELALIENIQREDLDPMERAQACKELIRNNGLSQEEVAERLGYERSTVSNLLRLLELPEAMREAVSRETISAGHGRALLRVNGMPEQKRIYDAIVKEGLSVRATEKACKAASAGGLGAKHKARPKKPAWVMELQEKIGRKVGAKTEITLKRRAGGRIVIQFQDLADLDRLAGLLDLPSEADELLG
jgi:ParB family chromosome partitioning protein